MNAAHEQFAAAADFFKTETLSQFVQTHHHGLNVLHKDATLADAMKVLSANKILSLPVVDDDEEYVGCISIGDLLRGLERSMEANLGENYTDSLATVSASEMDSIGKFFSEKNVGSLLHEADLWLRGEETTTLMTVIKKGFCINSAKVHHRIYICDPAKPTHHLTKRGGGTTVINIAPGSEKEGASSWRPTDVVSQGDVVKFLWENRAKLGDSLNLTLEQLDLADGFVYSVSADTPAIVAFHNMAVDRKSGVAVTDGPDGNLVGKVSSSDLRDLPVDHFALLLLPVGEFLAIVQGKGPSIEEAVSGKRPVGSSLELLKQTPLFSLKPSSTLGEVLELLITNGLHRSYVTDADGKPVAVITQTDILRLVVPKGRYSTLIGA
eukprot:gene24795-10439_t